jgi:hypothetical protein
MNRTRFSGLGRVQIILSVAKRNAWRRFFMPVAVVLVGIMAVMTAIVPEAATASRISESLHHG